MLLLVFPYCMDIQVKVFHWNSLLSEEVTNVPIQKKSLSKTEDQVDFQVPILQSLTAEDAGEIVFVSLSGKEGSKYVQGICAQMIYML